MKDGWNIRLKNAREKKQSDLKSSQRKKHIQINSAINTQI